ncbi:MAG TPA: hypothetical protein VE819_05290 [Steroidobacteraceae bacterium]|nr:hypothetical protein [Steroidobacteraceae bacterium]
MSATVVLLSTLLLAPAAPGAAHAPAAASCQSFGRDAQTVPPLVRAWFENSADERVVICPQTAGAAGEATAPLYFGEGAVSQHGAVCSYLSHGLTLSGSGAAARLQRYERSEARDMALAGASGCPRPHGATDPAAYVETYDVPAAAFEGIVRLWSTATAALAAGPNGHCCAAHAGAQPGAAEGRIAPEAREHIEAALGPDHMLSTTITRIVRIPGSVLHHRYAMFLTATDPAAGSAALYVIYVDKALRGPYEISAFAETN